MDAAVSHGSARAELVEIEARLRPEDNRSWALDRLEQLFTAGRSPDPPEGALTGRLVATSLSPRVDGAAMRVARLYMPWLGKSFDPVTHSGTNLLKTSARYPMKTLWPSYEPRVFVDRIEAFDFRTRVAAGELDPAVEVLKIDYDLDDNPRLIVRDILDELVQIEDDLYLGKILYRRSGSWRRVGFFSLQR